MKAPLNGAFFRQRASQTWFSIGACELLFSRARWLCIQVARWAKEVIDGFGLRATIKTSGSRGLHIYLPLPPKTPNEAATLAAQMIATKVADPHPKEATIIWATRPSALRRLGISGTKR